MQKSSYKSRRFCKGFSIVEVVIAMAVIAIVSFAGISVLTSAPGHTNKTRLQMLAINDVANLWECFEASQTQEQFDSSIAFSGLTIESKDGGSYVIKNSTYIYQINLTVVFGDGQRYFYAGVVNSETGKVLYTFPQ